MDVIIIQDVNGFASLEEQWADLLRNADFDSVFLSHQWLLCWMKHFAADASIRIVLVYDRQTLIAAAPLTIRKGKYRFFRVKELGFLENNESGRSTFILRRNYDDRTIIDVILKAVFAATREAWEIIQLRNVPSKDGMPEKLIEAFRQQGVLCGATPSTIAPYLIIDKAWSDFLDEKTKHFRKKIRNNINKVNAEKAVRVTKIDTLESFRDNLSKLRYISKNSWLAKARLDMFSDINRESFFVELSRVAAENKWLNIWLLEIDNRPIAFEYHLCYHDAVYALRACYCQAYDHLSPGFFLEATILKSHFDNYTEHGLFYDLCSGDHFYKKRWTSRNQNHMNVIAFKKSIKGFLFYTLEYVVIKKLREKIKHNKRLSRLVHALPCMPSMQSIDPPNEANADEKADNGSSYAIDRNLKARLIATYGVNEKEADLLTSSQALMTFFEKCARSVKNTRKMAGWVVNDLQGQLKRKGIDMESNPVGVETFTRLLDMLEDKSITAPMAKTALKQLFDTHKPLDVILAGLEHDQKNMDQSAHALIQGVLQRNSELVTRYRNGQKNLMNYFVGETMKASKGKYDPCQIRSLLNRELER